MSEHEESDEIFIPTPEEVDEGSSKARRRGRSVDEEAEPAEERSGFRGLLLKLTPRVGQSRGRAQPPPPARRVTTPEPQGEDLELLPQEARGGVDEELPTEQVVPVEDPQPSPDEPEAPAESPAPGTSRLRRIRFDQPEQPPRETRPSAYRSRNGAPGVLERAKQRGHVLGEFRENWDGPNRIEESNCLVCGMLGYAVFEVPEGWSQDTAYVQYKGPATNSTCKPKSGQ
ncbi:MAG: hypothetical protein WD064_04205 [Acidimicrobiia bacterium]